MSKQRSTLSKQHSTLLPQTATMSNELIVNFILSTKSKQIEHIQFVLTLSKERNFVRHCCRNRQHSCQKRQQCRKNRSTCSVRQCCVDIVAGVDGALGFLRRRRTCSVGLVYAANKLCGWTDSVWNGSTVKLLCLKKAGQLFIFRITLS